eukprot:COSAG01_NODE_65350_length_273_cov_1.195402_1_plen_48_part_10
MWRRCPLCHLVTHWLVRHAARRAHPSHLRDAAPAAAAAAAAPAAAAQL